MMENFDWMTIDWMTIIPAGLAVAILVGGMLMMFTGVWTSKDKL